MQLSVSQANWGNAQFRDIEVLLTDTASHLKQLLRNPFDGIIHVEPGSLNEDPIVLYRNFPEEPYIVRLPARDTYWCQFAYQFSHEFCHILSGYDRLKNNPNNWFHEAICELASIFTLRCMAARWPTQPPYPYWANYAEALRDYWENLISHQDVQLPKGMSLHYWLSHNEVTLRKNAYQRKKNALVANALLPIFERHPIGWNTIRNLPSSSGFLQDYFINWHSSVHPADKAFVAHLSNAFGYVVAS